MASYLGQEQRDDGTLGRCVESCFNVERMDAGALGLQCQKPGLGVATSSLVAALMGRVLWTGSPGTATGFGSLVAVLGAANG